MTDTETEMAPCIICDGSGDEVLADSGGGYVPDYPQHVTCNGCNGSGLSTETVEERAAYEAHMAEATAGLTFEPAPYTGGGGYGGGL